VLKSIYTACLPVGNRVGSLPNAESDSILYPWLIKVNFHFAHTLKFVCLMFAIFKSVRIQEDRSACSIYPSFVLDTIDGSVNL